MAVLMDGVGFRFILTPDQLSELIAAIPRRFKYFVRPGDTKPIGRGEFHQVDLKVLTAYPAQEPKVGGKIEPGEKVTVTREMVGELFDLLSIFPRAEKTKIQDILDSIGLEARRIKLISGGEKTPANLAEFVNRIRKAADSIQKSYNELAASLGIDAE